MTAQQISSFFSREAKRLRGLDSNDAAAAEEESNIQMLHEVVRESLLVDHPLRYEELNICNLVKDEKLSTLTLQKLKDICEHFEIDISSLNKKRKAPYITKIKDLQDQCTCVE